MNILNIRVHDRKIRGEITLPSSKSISNRALIIRHLSGLSFSIENLSDSDDTRLMIDLLHKIKANKLSNIPIPLHCNNAGTVFRFLTALLSITPGNWELRGNKQMTQRPVGPLVDALKKMGAKIEYLGQSGYPPLSIEGNPLKGRHITVDGSISSQFISALMMIGPVVPHGLKLTLENKINSLPYIQMTKGLMEHFGIEIEFDNNEITIPEMPYAAADLLVEPDWSSAAFWYEACALSEGGEVFLPGLPVKSIQGDAVLPEIFRLLGIETKAEHNGIRLTRSGAVSDRFIFNFSNNPDLALPVIVTCACLNIRGTFTGIENLRYKESDRLEAIVKELRNLGFNIELTPHNDIRTLPDGITGITGKQIKPVKTYADHRMAMTFAPLALLTKSLNIEEPEVVSKSYPAFWNDFQKVTSCSINTITNPGI